MVWVKDGHSKYRNQASVLFYIQLLKNSNMIGLFDDEKEGVNVHLIYLIFSWLMVPQFALRSRWNK